MPERVNSRFTCESGVGPDGEALVIVGFLNSNIESRMGLAAEELSDETIDGIADMMRTSRDSAIRKAREAREAAGRVLERELLGEYEPPVN